jgi:hypothetical protein
MERINMKSLKHYIVATFLLAGSIAAYGQTSLAGKWSGTENNLPTVDLTIEQGSGEAVFYLLKRNPGDSKAYVDAKADMPMKNLKYEGNDLTFDVQRRDGSLVSFRVQPTDADHATLLRTRDNVSFPLLRVKQ